MGVSDGKLVRLGGFPAGVNNMARETEGPKDQDGNETALRDGVNIDLDAAGKPRLTRGTALRVAGNAHSLHYFQGRVLGNLNGSLRAYNMGPDNLTEEAVVANGLGPRFITYASDDFDCWWSNGVDSGRIDDNLQPRPFWVDTPNPVTVAIAGNGGLAAGQYEVSVTVLDPEGRESGASGPVVVTLASGQGITVVFPAKPDDAVRWNVYVTPPNGAVLYLCSSHMIAANGTLIGAHTAGKALETAWLFPMPPVDILRHGHNRLLGIKNSALMWSEPYRIGLMHDENVIMLGERGTLLEPVGEGGDGAGWWVSDHKRVYWMDGADPKTWRQVVRRLHPAEPGTSIVVPGSMVGLEIDSPVAYWKGIDGVACLGLPGGQIVPLREHEFRQLSNASHGASALLQFNGIRQILTVSAGGQANFAAASDDAEATVRRNGIVL